jgi:hypothetical protein
MCDVFLMYEIDKRHQLDATNVIYYQKLSLHVSGIYMPIFRNTGCMPLHVVFQHCKRELGFNGRSCSVLYVVLCSC